LDGRDARDRLLYEAQVLAQLDGIGGFPKLFELLDDGEEATIVMEDVSGSSLLDCVIRVSTECTLPSVSSVVACSISIAKLLSEVHLAGWVYRDLKPANIIVAEPMGFRLIDAESVVRLGRFPCFNLGTRGYFSSRQGTSCPANVADDVYAFGMLLRYLCTACDPGSYLDPALAINAAVQMWNPKISPELSAIILKCLAHDAEDRYGSMEDVIAALSTITVTAVAAPRPQPGDHDASYNAGEMEDARRLVLRLGDSLVHLSFINGESENASNWLSDKTLDPEYIPRDLGTGLAGVVLVLADLVSAFGSNVHFKALQTAAYRLREASRPEGPGTAGLYSGEAGVGVALLRAGLVLRDDLLVEEAIRLSRSLGSVPYICPDLYSGTAGRIRFHLMLWRATGQREHLGFAVDAGEALVSSVTVTSQGAFWRIPAACGRLSEHIWIGYSHGVAGIADCLLDLAELSHPERFLGPVLDAIKLLQGLARPALEDGSGLRWPPALDNHSLGGAATTWCHGSAGIGRFLLHVAASGLDPTAAEQASYAANTVAHGARWALPVYCHGLAGAIDFLADMAQFPSQSSYLAEARRLGELLQLHLVERHGVTLCTSDEIDRPTPAYLTGLAGVASCFLRLAQPNRPQILSYDWGGPLV
jgi:hypothetical protein